MYRQGEVRTQVAGFYEYIGEGKRSMPEVWSKGRNRLRSKGKWLCVDKGSRILRRKGN